MKLLLVAGHGNGDYGVAVNGYKESELARDLVQRIWEIAVKNGMDAVIMRMDRDFYQVLKHGGWFDFRLYDIVLEIHFNSDIKMKELGLGNRRGTMLYVPKGRTDLQIEHNILKKIKLLRGEKENETEESGLLPCSEEIFTGGLLVQRKVEAQGVHHILLETLFLTNKKDIQFYLKKKDAIAQEIIRAIAFHDE